MSIIVVVLWLFDYYLPCGHGLSGGFVYYSDWNESLYDMWKEVFWLSWS